MDPRANVDRYGKSCPTGIRSLDCPARSESLADYAFPAHWQLPLFYANSGFVTVHLEILSLSHSGIMAVLQVLVIFYIYSDHKPWYSRITNYKLLYEPNCNYVAVHSETLDIPSRRPCFIVIQ